MSDDLLTLSDFAYGEAQTSGARIRYAMAGDGPPVLLLHGYPQTHRMWRKVAPALARTHTVVAADLRGYGDSGKPPGGTDHAGYAKRAMARDQVELMIGLGFDRFAVAGHDRGARVAHRLALDHGDRVERLAVLDIVPTHAVFARTDKAMATAYYHWFFLIQPYGFPEKLIGADPEWYLRRKITAWCRTPSPFPDVFDDDAVAEYVRCFSDPACIHATCEDYRAGAGIDLEHDGADFGHRRVTCPVFVLWGALGFVGQAYDVPAIWRDYADDVTAAALPCGHFLPEERPEETIAHLKHFLTGPAGESGASAPGSDQ